MSILISLVVILVFVGLALYLIGLLAFDATIKMLLQVVIAVIALLYIASLLF